MADTKRRWWLLGGVLLAGLAWASPWDIDMVDSVGFKAYEWKMLPARVEGTVQRPSGAIPRAYGNGHYQNDYVPEGDRMAPGTDAMHSPYPTDEKTVAKGERLFQVSCAPCHGVKGAGNGPVTYNKPDPDPKKAIRRFMPAPNLSGPGAITTSRSDEYIYYTIRNGSVMMPRYGVSLTDEERWAVVTYVRTLDGAAYVPPAPPAPTTPGVQ